MSKTALLTPRFESKPIARSRGVFFPFTHASPSPLLVTRNTWPVMGEGDVGVSERMIFIDQANPKSARIPRVVSPYINNVRGVDRKVEMETFFPFFFFFPPPIGKPRGKNVSSVP